MNGQFVESADLDSEQQRLVCELRLMWLLHLIETYDTDYARRYPLVLEALSCAATLGMEAGIRIDPDQPDWPVVVIELPTGQVSWHMPAHTRPWDGHSTGDKYRRARRYRRYIRDWHEGAARRE